MSSPVGKFLNLAMSTGMLPKDAMAEVPPAMANYFTQWFRARKFATRLHGNEREMVIMLVEADNNLLAVPCVLQENEDGKDVINRQLTSDGVNISGMMDDLPLLEIITSAINDGDPIKTMQRLQDLLAECIEANRLEEQRQLPATTATGHGPKELDEFLQEDLAQDDELVEEEDEDEENA